MQCVAYLAHCLRVQVFPGDNIVVFIDTVRVIWHVTDRTTRAGSRQTSVGCVDRFHPWIWDGNRGAGIGDRWDLETNYGRLHCICAFLCRLKFLWCLCVFLKLCVTLPCRTAVSRVAMCVCVCLPLILPSGSCGCITCSGVTRRVALFHWLLTADWSRTEVNQVSGE